MEYEAEALRAVAERLDGSLLKAVDLVLGSPGKVVVIGLGKSGLVGQKIAATLCSTGTPAVFLHAAEAVHGDLGVYAPGDVSILISRSGATAELVRLVPVLRQFNTALIGILGNLNSPLAKQVDVVLDGSVAREADPCNIAPTSSAVVALALGDALASALMVAKRFQLDDYARLHPGGQLGRNLCLTVREVMHPSPEIPCVEASTTLKELVIRMSHRPLGAACVLDDQDRLIGLVTDGDVRRALQKHEDIRQVKVADLMNRHPTTVSPDLVLNEAIHLMEDRPSQISVLPVTDPAGVCLGLIRIHDIYSAGLSSRGAEVGGR